MILDFDSYIINESSLKKLKKNLHGVLNMSARKRMRKELRDNIITFKFKKRNGEIRTAHGTLHPDYLPKLRGGAPRPEHQMVYYDLDKEGWRSFRSYSFIKILNLKPVDVKSIVVKPHTKSSKAEDDEEVKNTKPIEKEEEKEVKRPVHKEEPEDKEVKKPEPKKKERDEDEEKHEYKSPIYDETKDEKKEREEDDEKIEKLKHKDVIKKDEDNDNDKKKKEQTNESVMNPVEKYPDVTTLGDGEYDGVLWGQCFVYDGHKYYSEYGWRNMYPSYCRMIIHGNDAVPKQMDIYQRKELKKLFT